MPFSLPGPLLAGADAAIFILTEFTARTVPGGPAARKGFHGKFFTVTEEDNPGHSVAAAGVSPFLCI